jgi:serine/threonine protein kinase
MTLCKGSTIQGSRGTYTVDAPLCQGGMGRVFIGRSYNGNKIVIKEPRILGDNEDPIRIEKLKVEAEILSKIQHKNIVKYIDSKDNGATFYLVIEFVPGQTMRDAYWKNPAPETEVKEQTLALLNALNYLHGLNIIHRDVKPQNVLLNNGDLTLIDFGTAKHGYTQVLSFGHTIVGTQYWSAPEQFSGLATPRCDIYSTGAVMFFLLTGIPPQMYLKSDGSIESPKKVNPRISDEIANVVVKAMEFDPAKRFQIADDMIKEIEGRSIVHDLPCIFVRGKRYNIDSKLSIGRSSPADIIIDDNLCYVSRQHVDVFPYQGKIWIRDAGSKNGTFIFRNGVFQQVSTSELRDGDIIALCYKKDKGPYITFNFKQGNI